MVGEINGEAGFRGNKVISGGIEELKETNVEKCFKVALRYLSYRPRSETEIRHRLYRRGFDIETVEKTITRLKNKKLIDDVAFARFWVENRLLFKPKSRQLLSLELKQKGIAKGIIDEVTQEADDKFSALKVGQKRARCLAKLDYREFRYRLADYLKRRGFNSDIINWVVEHLWQEKQDAFLFDTPSRES